MFDLRRIVLFWLFGAWLLGGLTAVTAAADDPYQAERARMVATIEAHARHTPDALDGQALDPRVLEVMGRTPRHLFVPESRQARAYADRPLPIGYGQTISQPFIVALMTHLLKSEPDDAILEVGTGSAYQAAVVAPLVRQVCSIEIVPELGRSARERLEALGYANVRTRIGDGYYGWPECGPFDGILVTAAAAHVPPPLIEQLKPDGRMIIPVGGPFSLQHLVLVTKGPEGQVYTRQLLPVAFVPLRRRVE